MNSPPCGSCNLLIILVSGAAQTASRKRNWRRCGSCETTRANAPGVQAFSYVCASSLMHVILGCRCYTRSPPRQLALLDQSRPSNTSSKGCGPLATISKVGQGGMSEFEKEKWVAEARLDAILGASNASRKSVRSGVRCWMAFVGTTCS